MTERDAVREKDAALRETLAEALVYAPSSQLAYLAIAAGAGQTLDLNEIVDALLSRAQPVGEPVPTTLRNALRDPDYTPYCGDGSKCRMPRAVKTGHLTYKCPECGFEMDLRPALERLLTHPPVSGEPTEAMRQAGAEAFAREDGIKEFSKLEPAQRAHYKALTGIILTAALAAREGA